MTPQEKISAEEFEQQVRDCLTHLYDFTFLRDHPLVHLLTPTVTGASKVQVFRQVITEAIERLRPELGTTFHSKQARIYNLLMLRYVDQQQAQDVMAQLALSERQFYRDHPKAIQTLSALLWEKLTGEAIGTTDQVADISVESEVQRVSSQAENHPVDLKVLLDGAVLATQSLANQHDIKVEHALTDPLLIRGVNSAALRQAILLSMSQLIVGCEHGSRLHIDCQASSQTCQFVFTIYGSVGNLEAWQDSLAGQKSLQTLLDTIEGTFTAERKGDQESCITLDIPLNQQTVLIIDDNPGMIDLFERYLAGQAYRVLSAPDGDQAVQMARQLHPDVIVLDVMLPGTDGWEVLQNLKMHPATNNIPVLICSVLDAADLALSLGADMCLRKPPSQPDFLNALARWQG